MNQNIEITSAFLNPFIIKKIEKYIENHKTDYGYPIVLRGSWGVGKTTILELLKKRYQNYDRCFVFSVNETSSELDFAEEIAAQKSAEGMFFGLFNQIKEDEHKSVVSAYNRALNQLYNGT
eukprot:NODE_920_length_3051_cov_0.826897.p4 type:complete len:121 gc:universal NODE_920_length_3051_cov_0.826897:1582-1944(+)